MNKLKYIRIQNKDSSFGERFPIAVDSENVYMEEGINLQTQVENLHSQIADVMKHSGIYVGENEPTGENINILVFDTEVYSNTGGQASKATPKGAVAQFACSGKKTKKKNLAAMAISYESVYVASVALGANMNQCIKAFKEASDYNGVSLIVAYSPCIEHGIKGGMVNAVLEQKKAVECGHWSLFRYNPSLKIEGKDPFIMDSKEPSKPYEEFLQGERRFRNFLIKQRTFLKKEESEPGDFVLDITPL